MRKLLTRADPPRRTPKDIISRCSKITDRTTQRRTAHLHASGLATLTLASTSSAMSCCGSRFLFGDLAGSMVFTFPLVGEISITSTDVDRLLSAVRLGRLGATMEAVPVTWELFGRGNSRASMLDWLMLDMLGRAIGGWMLAYSGANIDGSGALVIVAGMRLLKRSARSSARNPLDLASSCGGELCGGGASGGERLTSTRLSMPLERGDSGSGRMKGGRRGGEILCRGSGRGNSLSSELEGLLPCLDAGPLYKPSPSGRRLTRLRFLEPSTSSIRFSSAILASSTVMTRSRSLRYSSEFPSTRSSISNSLRRMSSSLL